MGCLLSCRGEIDDLKRGGIISADSSLFGVELNGGRALALVREGKGDVRFIDRVLDADQDQLAVRKIADPADIREIVILVNRRVQLQGLFGRTSA